MNLEFTLLTIPDPFNDDLNLGGGFNLTQLDAINYVRKFSAETHRYGMSMGMKNAEDILPNITDVIDFAVNEECTTYEQGCKQYIPLIKAGKPVFHFEYVKVDNSAGFPNIQSIYGNWSKLSSPDILSYYCLRNSFGNTDFIGSEYTGMFSTAIKPLDLGGWVMYCDGSWADTPTFQTQSGPSEQPTRGGRAGRRGQEEEETRQQPQEQEQQQTASSSGSRPWYDPFGLFGGGRSVS
jgi:hypothetical protein